MRGERAPDGWIDSAALDSNTHAPKAAKESEQTRVRRNGEDRERLNASVVRACSGQQSVDASSVRVKRAGVTE